MRKEWFFFFREAIDSSRLTRDIGKACKDFCCLNSEEKKNNPRETTSQFAFDHRHGSDRNGWWNVRINVVYRRGKKVESNEEDYQTERIAELEEWKRERESMTCRLLYLNKGEFFSHVQEFSS